MGNHVPLISQDEKHDHSVVLQALNRLENGNEAAITSLRYSVLLLSIVYTHVQISLSHHLYLSPSCVIAGCLYCNQ